MKGAITPSHRKAEDRRGRPLNGLRRMWRMYLTRQCFGLSVEGIERAFYCRVRWHVEITRGAGKALPTDVTGKSHGAIRDAQGRHPCEDRAPFHSLTTHFKHSATRSQGLGKNEAQLVSRVGLRIFCISMNETIRIVFDTEISHPRANSSMASGRA